MCYINTVYCAKFQNSMNLYMIGYINPHYAVFLSAKMLKNNLDHFRNPSHFIQIMRMLFIDFCFYNYPKLYEMYQKVIFKFQYLDIWRINLRKQRRALLFFFINDIEI